jgi:ribosomal protein L31E
VQGAWREKLAKIGEIPGLTLAILLAVFTFLGSFSGVALNKFLPDASDRRETGVELVSLAIGILTESGAANAKNDKAVLALRKWAVDTISVYSRVQISPELKEALGSRLIDGQSQKMTVAASAMADRKTFGQRS